MADKKLNYTADEINELLGKTDNLSVPTKLSQLTNDTNFITSIPEEYITETELNNKNYATQSYVDSAITNAELGGEGGNSSSGGSYPILSWESGSVTDASYPVGDIRRYGAKCDGTTDDAAALQWALDNCCPEGVTVYIPEDKITVINTSIKLKTGSTWRYKLKSNQTNPTVHYIKQTCTNLFVGEKFYNSPIIFTEVMIEMVGIAINASATSKNCTAFKAIYLYGALILDCKFYHHYTVIEGGMGVGTKFTRNRLQSFRHAVMTSICRINENETFDDIKALFANNDYDIASLEGHLVEKGNSATDYSRYSYQSNDCYFSYNYVAGTQSLEYMPHTVFALETADSDFIICNNWFEFVKFAFTPTLRTTQYTSNAIIGTYFNENVFQYFHRFFAPGARYTEFTFNGNLFYGFNPTRLKEKFKNLNDPDIDNYKCGVFVSDYQETLKTYMTHMVIDNNYFCNNSYTFYVDSGTSGTSCKLSCREKGTRFKDNTNSPYLRLRNSSDLLNIDMECFGKYESSLPTCDTDTVVNSYAGRTIFVGGEMYVCVYDGSKVAYKKVTLE